MPSGSRAGAGRDGDEQRAWACLEQVMDPEIPVLSVVDLGIVRAVDRVEGGMRVRVTPTYSGCPATELIELKIAAALKRAGLPDARVERVLAPAWSSDWITPRGRQRLEAYGIAPPQADSERRPPCPHCGSTDTETVSEFGSTACKALHRCRSCLEPFDYFKCI